MKKIESLDNPEIKNIVKLKLSKYREKEQLFIVEGKRAIEPFLDSRYILQTVFLTQDNFEIAKNFNISDDNIRIVSEPVIKKLSSLETSPGILAIFQKPSMKLEKLQAGIILDGLRDPGNVGTLVRTAAALKLKNVLLIDCVDIYNQKVIQASAGAIAKIDVFELEMNELLSLKRDLKFIGLVVSGGKGPSEINDKNVALVIGSEAHGMSQELISACDYLVTIPMPGQIESLNAAVAGSIGMYLTFIKDL